jgi:hypothetical protein
VASSFTMRWTISSGKHSSCQLIRLDCPEAMAQSSSADTRNSHIPDALLQMDRIAHDNGFDFLTTLERFQLWQLELLEVNPW